ncbi:hypothetical protein [Bradyrhizobium tunisiense]|uniref:hypothetical protein n=1 Tax=Bradyrhizobium tunisiense TaxID=3278709 RepID=UPI0035DDEB1B
MRYTAFRLFGDFVWPPMPDDWLKTHPKNDTPASGVVEIHMLVDAIDKFVACVRWLPKESLSKFDGGYLVSAPFPGGAVENLYALTEAQLAQRVADPAQPCLFRIDGPSRAKGVRLQFRGAFLLDQFTLDEASDFDFDLRRDPIPAFRLPLVSLFRAGGHDLYSELLIGQPQNTNFRFNLAFPLPASLNVEQADIPYCAFTAVYRPIHQPPAGDRQALPCVALVFGRSGKNIPVDVPDPPYLGQFGFCESSAEPDFAVAGNDSFWPIPEILQKQLLAKLGFDTSLRDADKPFDLLIGDDDERSLNIRFANREFEGSIFYRVGLGLRAFGSPSAPLGKHLKVQDGKFQIAFPVGGDKEWLACGQRFYVDFELRYKIDSAQIWPDRELTDDRPANCDAVVRLGFDAGIGAGVGTGPLPGTKEPPSINVAGLLGHAIKAMRLARIDLRHLAPEQPQSLLPELSVGSAGERQFALFTSFPATLVKSGVVKWGMVDEAGRPRRPSFRLSLGDEEQYPATANKMIALKARLSSFHGRGTPASDNFPLELVHDPAATSDVSGNRPVMFKIRPGAGGGPGTRETSGVLGGLRFTRRGPQNLLDDGPGDRDYSYLRLAERIPIESVAGGNEALGAADLQMRLRLEIDDVKPISVDVPRGDRSGRVPPLLINETPSNVRKPSQFVLDITEEISGAADWRMTATLLEFVQETTTRGQFVLLGTEPFSVSRFYSRPIDARGDQGTVIVASYDSDTRMWEMKQVSRLYHYVFPPQSIGESMDKPRQLEIHDVPEGDTGGDGGSGFYRPYPPPDAKHEPNLRHRVVQFRLTPSAELWIKPSDVERGFFLPEWASHEIFRQRSELGLGAALEAFRGEFLYGLSVGISTANETGLARRSRVAEIEALTGRPVGAPRASRPDKSLAERWNALRGAIARRPERLEFWADDPDSDVAFAPARFRSGALFALRETALHRDPLRDLGSVEPEPAAAPTPTALSPRIHSHGLSGGALWAFESRNVLNSLLAAPSSTGGEIERIALSPLGGDADQKAQFRKGIITIISETRNGFVQRQKVEVIGRIGVFWHRAKHVVVYERTASPTAQFTPEEGLGTRTRRPVLRKVSEYIELLEPERSYPDFEAAQAQSCGFLRTVRFNSKIIYVDSAWSEDVDDFGWKIPLWNRYAARLRPQVYTRPDISFVTAAEGDAEDPTGAQECLNPDNIYFFTDTQAADDRTNLWPARLSIDCANLPAPSHAWQKDDGSDDDVGSGEIAKRNARRVPRGHARFSWSLAPPAQRTTINAGRSGKPLYVALDTITFMRSVAQPNDDSDLLKFATTPLKPDRVDVFGDYWAFGRSLKSPSPKLDELKDVAEGLGELFRNLLSDALPNAQQTADAKLAADKIRTKLEALALNAELKTQIANAKAIGDNLKDAKTELKELGEIISSAPGRCEKIADDFAGSLQRKKLLILDSVRSWENTALSAVDALPDGKEAVVRLVVDEIVEAVEPHFSQASEKVGQIGSSVEKARAVVREFKVALDDEIQRAVRDVDGFFAAYDHSKPWSPARLQEFDQKLSAIPERVIKNISAAVADAQCRLTTGLDNLAQEIASFVSRSLKAVDAQESVLLKSVGQAKLALEERLHQAKAAIGGLLAVDAADGRDRFEKLLAKLAEAKVEKPAYAARIEAFERMVEKLKVATVEARDAVGEVEGDLSDYSDDLKNSIVAAGKALTELGEAAIEFTHELESALSDFLSDLSAGVKDPLIEGVGTVRDALSPYVDSLFKRMKAAGHWVDVVGNAVRSQLTDAATTIQRFVDDASALIDQVGLDIDTSVKGLEAALSPAGALQQILKPHVFAPAVEKLLSSLESGFFETSLDDAVVKARLARLRQLLKSASAEVEAFLDSLSSGVVAQLGPISEICRRVAGGVSDVYNYFKSELDTVEDKIKAEAKRIQDEVLAQIDGAVGDLEKYRKFYDATRNIDRDIRKIGNDLARSREMAEAYGERVLESAANVTKGGLLAAPNNILRLYAAVASAPDLPNLDFARDRLGYYYGRLNDIVDTTPVEVWFGRLGDELKALGFSLPFNKIGEGLKFDDLSNFDIPRALKKVAGLDISKLFKGYKLPAGTQDAIRVTHDFDKKAFRAWVQVDIDLPMPGRKALFTVGPFRLDFVNSNLRAFVRLEASKDTEKVEQSGNASIGTDIEAMVSGQMMVALRKVVVRYDKGGGLKVDFDPKNIDLNSVFQFIQNTLGQLYGDEIGGLRILKLNGMPVGVSHDFSMPPLSLMYGTSGVTNIQISNQFQLVAYPDFLIANRFSLAKPELPFIFSIFIIGGTGWLSVDAEYRPFGNGLLVIVEAAAGGSASLGFAFSGVTGSVAITISVALTYRKLIGQSGGGLTVALVVLIVGNVDVLGIVNVYIALMLRLSYRDSGDIDAVGTLILTIRITRFFKLTVRREVRYEMKGGSTKKTESGSTEIETDPKFQAAADKAKKLLQSQK